MRDPRAGLAGWPVTLVTPAIPVSPVTPAPPVSRR
jgi:hypothetical protein